MTRNVDGQVSGVFLLPFHTLLSKVLFFQRVSGVGVDTYGNSGVVRGYFCVKKKNAGGRGLSVFSGTVTTTSNMCGTAVI